MLSPLLAMFGHCAVHDHFADFRLQLPDILQVTYLNCMVFTSSCIHTLSENRVKYITEYNDFICVLVRRSLEKIRNTVLKKRLRPYVYERYSSLPLLRYFGEKKGL